MDELAVLKAQEAEIAREWEWLHAALVELVEARAEEREGRAVMLLQQQALDVGRRRVSIQVRAAELGLMSLSQ